MLLTFYPGWDEPSQKTDKTPDTECETSQKMYRKLIAYLPILLAIALDTAMASPPKDSAAVVSGGGVWSVFPLSCDQRRIQHGVCGTHLRTPDCWLSHLP